MPVRDGRLRRPWLHSVIFAFFLQIRHSFGALLPRPLKGPRNDKKTFSFKRRKLRQSVAVLPWGHIKDFLTESSKVSKFSKEEFEAYQKMFHEKWDHNVLKDSFFEEFADEINAKVNESVLDSKREMAKAMIADGMPLDKVMAYSGLSEEEIRKL